MECCFCHKEIEPMLDRNGEVARFPWGTPIYDRGNSAEPIIADGRCCNTCNTQKVVPVRYAASIGLMLKAPKSE